MILFVAPYPTLTTGNLHPFRRVSYGISKIPRRVPGLLKESKPSASYARIAGRRENTRHMSVLS